MREIEFRGRAEEDGEWMYGDLIHGVETRIRICDGGDIPVKPATVGQYTGLRDKHGKKIYEGDILRESETGRSVAIEWKDFQWGFVYTRNDFGYVWPNHTENFEVIGNIHDNPELIKA